jgi:hypothetical protein
MPRSKIKKPSSPKFSARPGRKRSRVVVADARESARATDSCSATLVTTAHVEEASELALREKRRIERWLEERRKRAREFWGNEFLERAHRENPEFGADALAQRARNMAAEDFEERLARQPLAPEEEKKERARDAEKRDKINKYRAGIYLATVRKPRDV